MENSIASDSPSQSPSSEWSTPPISPQVNLNRIKNDVLSSKISISEERRLDSSSLQNNNNDGGSLYWNASLLYYTGLAISPKVKKQNLRSSVSMSDMNRPLSPLYTKYLKKSPSNDSGTGTCSSGVTVDGCNGDQMSPLRRRHLSCGSSSTTSSSSMGSSKDKTKKLSASSSSSMRLMKAISKRPSLSSFMERTQSLGRYGRNKSASPVGNNLEETSSTSIETTAAPTSSTSSGLSSTAKVFRDSFRAARNLLPKGNSTKASKATVSSERKKVSSDTNGSASTINYSAPNTPVVQGKSFGSSDNISKNKVFRIEQTSSKKGILPEKAEENNSNEVYIADSSVSNPGGSKSIGSKLKKTKDRNKKPLDDTTSEEKVPTKKKVSLVKSLARKIRNRSKERKEEDAESKCVSNLSESKNLSPSQEILELDDEPKVRTPKTLRQRRSTLEKDRECNEMEVSEEGLEISSHEKLSKENVTNKSSKKVKGEKKKSQNSLPLSSSVIAEDGKKKNSKKEGKKGAAVGGTASITMGDDEKKKDFPGTSEKDTIHENDLRDKANKSGKKKSWSDVVSSSSQEKLLETKLDLDNENGEDEIKSGPGANHLKPLDDNIPPLDNNHETVVSSYAEATFAQEAYQLENNSAEVQVNDVTISTQENKNLVEGQTTTNEDDEEPSCTDSFRQLKPFNFDLDPVEEGKRERLYKVLVVGELGSGKTSIIKRYVHQFFSQHYRATIGVDFALKVLRWDPDTVVRLQLWDIAGQERFGSMTRVYYKEAVGAFVVFDVTRSATLEAVPKWKADLDSKVALPDGRPIPTILLANKSDQPKEGIAANREKMNDFCQQQGFSAWFETSAKDNINIDESANFLVSKILEMDRWSQEPLAPDPDKVDLSANGKHKPNSTSSNCAC